MPGGVKLKNATWGITYLGRDEKTWGKDGIGSIPIDPDVCNPAPDRCPYYRDREYDLDNDKIHLVVASFRDQLCPRTMYNIFSRAANPHRIFVRVLQQVKPDSDLPDDADCWEMACNTYNSEPEEGGEGDEQPEHTLHSNNGKAFNCHDFESNVEFVTLDAGLAQGPCDARSKLSALIEYDYRHSQDGKHRLHPVDVRDYCMQTDSHMDFSTDYDKGLIQMFHRAENDRAVLSTYVTSMTENNKDPKEVPNLCMITFTSTWRNWGTKLLRHAKKPKLTNLVWGAGMSFQKCHAELNVPYDPFLDNVFDGEETSRGIRFFTHGYDVYTPDKVLVTHDYEGHQSNPNVHSWGRKGHKNLDELQLSNRKRKELFENSDWSFMDYITKMRDVVKPKGVDRINILMGIHHDRHGVKTPKPDPDTIRLINEGRFGLGHARTLEQAYEYAGFSPMDQQMHFNKCGNLKWVPFEDNDDFNEKNDWGVAINLQRRIWNEKEALLPPPPPSSSSLAAAAAAAAGKGEGVVVLPEAKVASANSHQQQQSRYLISSNNEARAFSHGPTFRALGWIGMMALFVGGMLRGKMFRGRKSERSQL